MNFRAIIGRDLNSTLESDYHEMPVDRIAAFSKAARLGTCLWRLKWGFDPLVYRNAVDLLAEQAGVDSERGKLLCELVINEWLTPVCPACEGVSERIIDDRKVTCPKCRGSGLKRHSDASRAKHLDMTVEEWRGVASLFKRVLERLSRCERLVSAQMHVELER